MRGPFVYCFEGKDNGSDLQSCHIAEEMKAEPFPFEEGMLKGMMGIHVDGWKYTGSDELYSEEKPHKEKIRLTAIPYYAWETEAKTK